MTLGKIKHSVIKKNAEGEFGGMDVTAEFLNKEGKPSVISFHYDFFSLDVRGLVEKAIHYHENSQGVPEHFSNVVV